MQVLYFSQEIATNCYDYTWLEETRMLKGEKLSQELENKVCKHQFLQEYCERVKNNLSIKRFAHVLRVTQLASEIAISNKFSKKDYEATVLAAFLHDAARELSKEEMFAQAKPELEAEENHFMMLHGKAGRKLAKSWGVDDSFVLEAIEGHVLGVYPTNKVGMAVYIADVSEPGRGVNDEIRELAFLDLCSAYKQAINIKINYLQSKAIGIHPHTLKIYEEICDFK